MISVLARVPAIVMRLGGSRAFGAVEPAGGWLIAFNTTTGTLGNLMDLIATMVDDYANAVGRTYTITTSPGVRAFDPTAGDIDELYDVASTLAGDQMATAAVYTVTEPFSKKYTYNPNTEGLAVAFRVLGTLILQLQEDGTIG